MHRGLCGAINVQDLATALTVPASAPHGLSWGTHEREVQPWAGGARSSCCLGSCQVQFILIGFCQAQQGQHEGEEKVGGMVPEVLQLLFHSTSAGSCLRGGNGYCKVRSCCFTQEQAHSFQSEEEGRKECAGFQNGAVAIVHLVERIAM